MKLLSYIALLGFIAACNNPKESPEVYRTRVEAFADRIESDLANGKLSVLDLHFDKGTFVNRVVSDPIWDKQLTSQKALDYKQSYQQDLMQQLSLGGLFLSGIDSRKFFSYDLLKIYRIENRWHAVFRIYANDAINYHDMLLRVDSSKVWIEDVYIMAVGRQLSKIMQETYVAGFPSQDNTARLRDNQLLQRSKILLDAQDYGRALATLDSISLDYKEQKSLRLFRLQIAANMPNEAYVRDLERFERDYPDDAGTVLFQIDKNFLYGNYPEVLRNLAQLDKMYGHDPVVDYLKANALNALDQCTQAAPLYQGVLNAKPAWQEPLLNWIDCMIKQRKYSEAMRIVRTYEMDFNLTPSYVRYLFDREPNFFLSDEFLIWAETYAYPEDSNLVNGPAL